MIVVLWVGVGCSSWVQGWIDGSIKPSTNPRPNNTQQPPNETGADPTAEDAQGNTVLQLAKDGGAPKRIVNRIEVSKSGKFGDGWWCVGAFV